MDFHDIANVFPLLAEPELAALADDIAAHSLHQPVTLFQGAILDGRNRFLACHRAGVEPRFTTFTGNWSAALAFVASQNLHRRHLSESQRAWAANRLATLRPGQRPPAASKEAAGADDLQARPGASYPGQTDDAPETTALSQAQAAQALGVSRSAVQRAAVVARHGVPELGAAVARGEIRVGTAAELSELPPAVQRAVLAAGNPRAHREVRELRTPAQRWRDGAALVGELILLTRRLRAVGEVLAAGELALGPDDQLLVERAVEQLDLGVGWLKTLTRGGITDDALSSWLAQGKD